MFSLSFRKLVLGFAIVTLSSCGVSTSSNHESSQVKDVEVDGTSVTGFYRITDVAISLKENETSITPRSVNCPDSKFGVALTDSDPNVRQNWMFVRCDSDENETIVHDQRNSPERVFDYYKDEMTSLFQKNINESNHLWTKLKKGDCVMLSGSRRSIVNSQIISDLIAVIPCELAPKTEGGIRIGTPRGQSVDAIYRIVKKEISNNSDPSEACRESQVGLALPQDNPNVVQSWMHVTCNEDEFKTLMHSNRSNNFVLNYNKVKSLNNNHLTDKNNFWKVAKEGSCVWVEGVRLNPANSQILSLAVVFVDCPRPQ